MHSTTEHCHALFFLEQTLYCKHNQLSTTVVELVPIVVVDKLLSLESIILVVESVTLVVQLLAVCTMYMYIYM